MKDVLLYMKFAATTKEDADRIDNIMNDEAKMTAFGQLYSNYVEALNQNPTLQNIINEASKTATILGSNLVRDAGGIIAAGLLTGGIGAIPVIAAAAAGAASGAISNNYYNVLHDEICHLQEYIQYKDSKQKLAEYITLKCQENDPTITLEDVKDFLENTTNIKIPNKETNLEVQKSDKNQEDFQGIFTKNFVINLLSSDPNFIASVATIATSPVGAIVEGVKFAGSAINSFLDSKEEVTANVALKTIKDSIEEFREKSELEYKAYEEISHGSFESRIKQVQKTFDSNTNTTRKEVSRKYDLAEAALKERATTEVLYNNSQDPKFIQDIIVGVDDKRGRQKRIAEGKATELDNELNNLELEITHVQNELKNNKQELFNAKSGDAKNRIRNINFNNEQDILNATEERNKLYQIKSEEIKNKKQLQKQKISGIEKIQIDQIEAASSSEMAAVSDDNSQITSLEESIRTLDKEIKDLEKEQHNLIEEKEQIVEIKLIYDQTYNKNIELNNKLDLLINKKNEILESATPELQHQKDFSKKFKDDITNKMEEIKTEDELYGEEQLTPTSIEKTLMITTPKVVGKYYDTTEYNKGPLEILEEIAAHEEELHEKLEELDSTLNISIEESKIKIEENKKQAESNKLKQNKEQIEKLVSFIEQGNSDEAKKILSKLDKDILAKTSCRKNNNIYEHLTRSDTIKSASDDPNKSDALTNIIIELEKKGLSRTQGSMDSYKRELEFLKKHIEKNDTDKIELSIKNIPKDLLIIDHSPIKNSYAEQFNQLIDDVIDNGKIDIAQKLIMKLPEEKQKEKLEKIEQIEKDAKDLREFITNHEHKRKIKIDSISETIKKNPAILKIKTTNPKNKEEQISLIQLVAQKNSGSHIMAELLNAKDKSGNHIFSTIDIKAAREEIEKHKTWFSYFTRGRAHTTDKHLVNYLKQHQDSTISAAVTNPMHPNTKSSNTPSH